MKLFVATHNAHKIREISQILPDFEVVPDDPAGVEENAPDFAGNALIKVRAIAAKHPGAWCMADDSGLEVAALGGAPGVHSARYAGEPANTPANNALLLKNLEGVADRRARFTCCCALVDPSGEEHVVHGHCPGRIAEKAAGVEGFGYDPLFVPDGHDKSFAELSADEKNAISHRGRALEKVKAILGGGSESSPAVDSNTQTPKHSNTILSWLRLFRVVNLPTVPGDVLVGAAAFICFTSQCRRTVAFDAAAGLRLSAFAALAAVFMYMFGLADNDIVGARGDANRPIPEGALSLGAARIARALCLCAVMLVGLAAGLPPAWWGVSFATSLAVVVYNRTKWSTAMGLCRALNVLGGVAAMVVCLEMRNDVPLGTMEDVVVSAVFWAPAVFIWWLYTTLVTWYSKGEERDPEKKRAVGALVGGIIYLQLLAFLLLAFACPQVAAMRPLLVAGAVLLAVLRFSKRLFPTVSAS